MYLVAKSVNTQTYTGLVGHAYLELLLVSFLRLYLSHPAPNLHLEQTFIGSGPAKSRATLWNVVGNVRAIGKSGVSKAMACSR